MKLLYCKIVALTIVFQFASCQTYRSVNMLHKSNYQQTKESKFIDKPLVESIYTADPSAHIFDNKIYIYASHDIESGGIEDDSGNHFNMIDYQVLSMDYIGGKTTVHPVGLSVEDVPWAVSKFWAPDAAYKNGKYYLYFPAKDKNNIFRIGVATSKYPQGPFKAEPKPIKGSYSIDPAVFKDDDGSFYMYFGGIWGGQLQRWENEKYDANGSLKDLGKPEQPAVLPRIAKLSADMKSFAEPIKRIQILDEKGELLLTKDLDRRFFEAPWIHKKDGTYYLSYSTGDTHLLVYATAKNPYGPFVYKGVLNKPVQGWTNHHSVIEVNGKWYLFYHDTELTNKTHLRNVKVTELIHNKDGSIQTINTMRN